jgi:hypothetical protein
MLMQFSLYENHDSFLSKSKFHLFYNFFIKFLQFFMKWFTICFKFSLFLIDIIFLICVIFSFLTGWKNWRDQKMKVFAFIKSNYYLLELLSFTFVVSSGCWGRILKLLNLRVDDGENTMKDKNEKFSILIVITIYVDYRQLLQMLVGLMDRVFFHM